LQSSVFKSSKSKETEIAINKEFPGAADYITEKYKAIGHQEFQGGAANNFLALSQGPNLMKTPPVKIQPRMPPLAETTPG
jgi:hypothetical protein